MRHPGAARPVAPDGADKAQDPSPDPVNNESKRVAGMEDLRWIAIWFDDERAAIIRAASKAIEAWTMRVARPRFRAEARADKAERERDIWKASREAMQAPTNLCQANPWAAIQTDQAELKRMLEAAHRVALDEHTHWMKEAAKHARQSGPNSDCAMRDRERARIAQRIADKLCAALALKSQEEGL